MKSQSSISSPRIVLIGHAARISGPLMSPAWQGLHAFLQLLCSIKPAPDGSGQGDGFSRLARHSWQGRVAWACPLGQRAAAAFCALCQGE
jgi:hypothetical protein